MKSEQEIRDELERLQEVEPSTGREHLQWRARVNKLEWVLDDD